jgi:hypothetical protein
MVRLESDSGGVEAKHFSNEPPSIYLRDRPAKFTGQAQEQRRAEWAQDLTVLFPGRLPRG